MVSPRPVFRASHRSVLRAVLPAGQNPDAALLTRSNPGDPEDIRGRRVFAFSGLAHNNAFWDSLHKFGAQLEGTLGFRDHHPYNETDTECIVRAARLAGGDYLVTTDKDYVRLPRKVRFPLDLFVMGICIEFGKNQEQWQRFIENRMKMFT
jgi:tetraacyldisaccharide 4'-kinase